jgi:dipeptidyl aminopeptidase/acylaminoacyl peptidase
VLARLVIALGIASAVVASAAAAPHSATPVFNGRIVFSTGDGMASMNPDGSGQWGLRFTRSGQGTPAWAPDGSAIALSYPGLGLVLMDPDGTNIRPIISNLNAQNPSWSPDGKQLAFDDGTTIYTVNVDGTGLKRLLNGSEPAWSPDGKTIAFTSQTTDEGVVDIFTIDIATGQAARLTRAPNNDQSPAWSPDGKGIVFVSFRSGEPELYRMNADGSDQAPLPGATGYVSDPTWSPDGTEIAYVDAGAIWTIGADGSSLRQLTIPISAGSPSWQPLPPGPPGCTLWGTPANDLLVGTPGDDVICGLGGDDSLIGMDGNDRLLGGPGNDWIAGGRGRDVLNGGDGNDLIDARDGNPDSVTGGAGEDRVLVDAGSGDKVAGVEHRVVSKNVAAWRPVTASSQEPTNPAVLAVDGRVDDYWSSGNYPPQWIEVDLLKPTTIARLRLIAPDVPMGASILLLARQPDGSFRLLHRFAGPMVFEQAVSFTPKRPWRGIRYLRLSVPSQSYGWVAWPEIEAYSP